MTQAIITFHKGRDVSVELKGLEDVNYPKISRAHTLLVRAFREAHGKQRAAINQAAIDAEAKAAEKAKAEEEKFHKKEDERLKKAAAKRVKKAKE